jgi:3'-phosphoadenosine 5'-phosphosulfate (PAPS) 3'-phosphatase
MEITRDGNRALDLQRELGVAILLARESGKIIMEHATPGIRVSQKVASGTASDVTDADISSDRHIRSGIAKAFPSDAMLTEESADDLLRLGRQRVWEIDPLDGTSNFKEYARSGRTNGDYSYFSVHIGLAIEGRPVLGVVFNPAASQLFYAVKGEGAYKVTFGGGSQAPQRLATNPLAGVVLHRDMYADSTMEAITRNFDFVDRPFKRSCGCHFVAVAEGALGAYFSFSNKHPTMEWDTCAPHVIVEEAGGIMTDLHGGELIYNKAVPAFDDGVCAQAAMGVVPLLLRS